MGVSSAPMGMTMSCAMTSVRKRPPRRCATQKAGTTFSDDACGLALM
jgi:hypothetical protein